MVHLLTIYDAVPDSYCLGFKRRKSRRGGRAVECGGLESRPIDYLGRSRVLGDADDVAAQAEPARLDEAASRWTRIHAQHTSSKPHPPPTIGSNTTLRLRYPARGEVAERLNAAVSKTAATRDT